jgi:hypothetical protein
MQTVSSAPSAATRRAEATNMATNMPEWLRGLGYIMAGGAGPRGTSDGLTPWILWRIVGALLWGSAIAVFIFCTLNSALRTAGVGGHLAISFAAMVVYAVVAIVLTVVNRVCPGEMF